MTILFNLDLISRIIILIFPGSIGDLKDSYMSKKDQAQPYILYFKTLFAWPSHMLRHEFAIGSVLLHELGVFAETSYAPSI